MNILHLVELSGFDSLKHQQRGVMIHKRGWKEGALEASHYRKT